MKKCILTKEDKIVLALGFFDSVHIAHQKIIKETIELSKELGAEPTIFTFNNNPYTFFNKNEQPMYDLAERTKLYQLYGINKFVAFSFDKDFADITAEDFLRLLINNYNIVGFVAGYDYTFGKGGTGNYEYLKQFSKVNGIICKRVDEIMIDNEKVGTTQIKEYLKQGKVEKANSLLGRAYSVFGKEMTGRGDGKKSGHPTINIAIPNNFALKEGVYSTKTIVNGISYSSVTNVGTQPTYNDENRRIETHLLETNVDYYNEIIIIEFYSFLRDIVKFESKSDLHNQIEKDIIKTKEMLS